MKKARRRPPPAPAASPRPQPPPVRLPWRERPVGWPAVFALGVATLAAPGWLSADPLGGFRWNESLSGLASEVVSVADPLGSARLSPEDLPFVAGSRTWPALRHSLFAPSDGQAVPLFRVLAALLTRVSGHLEGLATVLSMGSYAALLAVIAAVGHLVAREDRRLAVALAAMAGVGASSVLEPATARFASSRALWAGLAVLAMLIMLRDWRSRGGAWRLAVALAAGAAAPLAGPGGLAAGPAGLAYLLADGRPRCRKAAPLPLLAAALAGAVSLAGGLAGFHPLRGAWRALRAVPEVLVLNNLGLDVPTTPVQEVVLVLALAAAWAWSRSCSKPNPLEAAGATLAIIALWLDGSPAVAQVGAVLFAAGWWSGSHGTGRDPTEPVRLTPPTRAEALAVLAVLAVLCVAETPRFRRLGRSRVYPISPAEAKMFPIPTLQWWRTKYLADEMAARQDRFLKRLDQVEARCLARGIGRGALRLALGRVEGPGLPGRDTIALLALPEDGRELDPDSVRSVVGSSLDPEPEPRPQWMPPGEPWPPPESTR